MAYVLFELAHALRFFPHLQNKLLAASWNAQRCSGRGPWEID